MVREVFFFTEMAYSAYPQDIAEKYGYTALMLPNTHFDPHKARGLYAWYFDEHQYASEVGFDGIMINQHHNNPLNRAVTDAAQPAAAQETQWRTPL